jgi:hypothetical protein
MFGEAESLNEEPNIPFAMRLVSALQPIIYMDV